MKTGVFSLLGVEKIFIISQKSPERLNNINHFKSLLNFEAEIIEPVPHEKGSYSLGMTNLKILKENRGFNLLILEDDFFTCLTPEQIKERFTSFKEQNLDFDVLSLGCDPQTYDNNSKNVIKLQVFQDNQAIIFKKECVDAVIRDLNNLGTDDFYDRYLSGLMIRQNLKFYTFFPSVFTQQPFYSSIDKYFKIKYEKNFGILKEIDLGLINIEDFESWPQSKIIYSLNGDFKRDSCNLTIRVINSFTGVIHYHYSFDVNKHASYYSEWASKNSTDACDYWVEFYLDGELVFRQIFSRRILISIPASGLGDTLCATPTLTKLYKAENQLIDVVTHHPEIFKNNPYIYRIYDMNKYVLRTNEDYKKLWARYGKERKFTIFEYCGHKNEQLIQKKHASYDLRRLTASDLGFDLLPTEMSLFYEPDPLKIDLPSKKYIVLNPQITWGARTWPVEKWNRLLKILNDNNITSCLVGKKGEIDDVGEKGFCDVRGNFIDYRDKLSLSDTYHVIANSLCVITMDSGLMHLAGCSDTFIFQLGSSIHPYYRSPYRNSSQQYKYEYIIGDCDIHCASDLKYYKKNHNTFNDIPYLPSCLEKKPSFECHPSPEKVAEKVLKFINENNICNN